jgi:DNA-binding transcriptional LysR family regulator
MFAKVEVRHLHAVTILAEELNFTRAAQKLHITQSALSKQITEVERHHGFKLFVRDRKRNVDLTDPGRIFVEEARLALLHIDRAVQFGHATREGSDSILTVGHSPDADQSWVAAILAIRLPLYTKLHIRLASQLPGDLVRNVMGGELNLALAMAPPEDSQITRVPFALTPLYAVLPESHAAARKERLELTDLGNDQWILSARRVHSVVHDVIMETAERAGIRPKHAHDVVTGHEAVHLVCHHLGVAIIPKPPTVDFSVQGIVVKPLTDASLCFETCLIMRSDDNSRLTNEFARFFLRRYAPQIWAPKQMELSLSA